MLLSLTLKFTAVSCPKCNALVGQPCHTASGRKIAVLYPHADRVRVFAGRFAKAASKNPELATKPHLADKLPA
jgi:hypothetical protein